MRIEISAHCRYAGHDGADVATVFTPLLTAPCTACCENIDAGEPGIAGGKIILAAQHMNNAANISIGGGSTGMSQTRMELPRGGHWQGPEKAKRQSDRRRIRLERRKGTGEADY